MADTYMATKIKETTPKEKRGTSPSVCKEADGSNSSSPSDKRIPNYLKPTISSRNEFSKIIKKNGAQDAINKPYLARRRSFDKPPPPSRSLQKNLSLGPIERPITSRSSSLPVKTAGVPKPKFNKMLIKSSGRSPTSSVKSVKQNSTPAIRKKISSCGSGSGSSKDSKNKEEDKESMGSEIEEIVKTEIQSDVVETDYGEDEELELLCGNSTISEDFSVFSSVGGLDEEKIEDQEKEEDNSNEEKQAEESLDKVEVEEQLENMEFTEISQDRNELDVKDNVQEDSEDKNKLEDQMVDETEKVDGGIQKLEEQKDGAKVVAEESNAVAKSQGSHGKKESMAYNDVIEETAGKLLEKRKNKVKALVGAFETVISLQEP